MGIQGRGVAGGEGEGRLVGEGRVVGEGLAGRTAVALISPGAWGGHAEPE